MATSAQYQGLPVPSMTRPPIISKSSIRSFVLKKITASRTCSIRAQFNGTNYRIIIVRAIVERISQIPYCFAHNPIQLFLALQGLYLLLSENPLEECAYECYGNAF